MYNGYRSVIGFKTKQLILYSVYRTLSRKDSAEMLGIPQDASKKEVKQAYLQMAKQFHPDNKVNDYLIIYSLAAFIGSPGYWVTFRKNFDQGLLGHFKIS